MNLRQVLAGAEDLEKACLVLGSSSDFASPVIVSIQSRAQELRRALVGIAWNIMPRLLHSVGELKNGTSYKILAVAADRDVDGSWRQIMVVEFDGPLPRYEGAIDEGAIMAQLSATTGIYWQSEGSGGPGEHFADAPHFRAYGQIVTITQHGGRDV